uniref:Uncharacterized protein n=1 Tax=Brassica oleracea var. oleracea TaxID=109376 RepID=A0A0D3BRK8_BRAOL
MNLVNPRPPSCSSRRGEYVATKNASIGVRTKPHAPPQVSPTARVSFTRRRLRRRHRVCFMLELGLHFSSAMNSACETDEQE